MTAGGGASQCVKKRPNLIERAITLVKGFNPATQTSDSYADDVLGSSGHHRRGATEGIPASDLMFLKQVLYGCLRCKEALRVFLNHYYNDMAGSVLRGDYTLYMILGYLLLFRLDELGFDEFRQLTSSEDPIKMAHLLTYLTNRERVQVQLTQDWLTVFDLTYINEAMLGGLVRASGAIEEHCERLAVKAFGLAKAREEAKAKMGLAEVEHRALTVPRPFDLTKPNPRRVPEPMKISQTVVVGASTDRLYRTNLAEVETCKKKRLDALKRETVQKYKDAEQAGQGKFRLHETRNTLDALKEEAEQRTISELQFDKRFKTNVPHYPEEGAQVRLNAAAILREDALLKKKQGHDAQLIKSFEGELRDSTEYYLWQAEMREKDVAIRKEQMERKRAYAKASQRAARDALEMQRAANSEIVSRMKSEKEAMRDQRDAEEDLAIIMNQRLVKEVTEVRDTAPRDAVQHMLDEKKWIKDRLCAEMEEARKARKRKEMEEEAARKESVLKLKEQEIHEHHTQVFDPTESAGLGLLNEMSLVETKARLEANGRRRQEEEAIKRKDILLKKARREADLRERLEGIKERRAAARKANVDAMKQHKQKEAMKAEADRLQWERNNRMLMEELENKKLAREAEHLQLADEEERRTKAAMYLGRAAAAVEEGNFRQLLRGAEREAERRQRVARDAAERYQNVTNEDRRQIEENTRKKESRKKRLYDQKQTEFALARTRLLEEQREEMHQRQESFKRAREKAKEVRRKIVNHNPYANTVNHESVERGRRHIVVKAAAAAATTATTAVTNALCS